jgi:hypothetical protein
MSAYKIVHNMTTKADAYGLRRVWPASAPGGEKWVMVTYFLTDPYRGPMGGRPTWPQHAEPLSYWEHKDHNGHVWVAVDATLAEVNRLALL